MANRRERRCSKCGRVEPDDGFDPPEGPCVAGGTGGHDWLPVTRKSGQDEKSPPPLRPRYDV
jgi:hypothetical protein